MSTRYGMPLRTMSIKLSPRFLRFLLVGLLNTAVGYGLFAFLTWLGLLYPLAIGLATLGGVVFNFQSIGRLVFNRSHWSRLGRFAAVYCVLYGLNVAGVALLLKADLNVYVANALLIIPLALIAYLLQQKFVFTAP